MKFFEDFGETKSDVSSPLFDPTSISSQLLFSLFSSKKKGESFSEPLVIRADPISIAQACEALRIVPTVECWLLRHLPKPYSTDAAILLQQLKTINFRQKVFSRLLFRTYFQISDCLIEVPHLFMKGLAVGHTLYGSVDYRYTGDIDVLVSPKHTYDAIERLIHAGYSVVKNSPCHMHSDDRCDCIPTKKDIETRQSSILEKEINLQHPGTRTLMELHWALGTPTSMLPNADDVLVRRRLLDFGAFNGPSIPTMSLLDQAFVLWQRFYDHCGFLKGLLDISCCLDVLSLNDLQELRSIFNHLHTTYIFELPLNILRRLHIRSDKLNTLYSERQNAPLSINYQAMRYLSENLASEISGLFLSNSTIDDEHPLSHANSHLRSSNLIEKMTSEFAKILMVQSPIDQTYLTVSRLRDLFFETSKQIKIRSIRP